MTAGAGAEYPTLQVRRLGQRILEYSPALAFFLLWEFAARSGMIRPLFLPSLTDIFTQFLELMAKGEVIYPLLTSVYRASVGLAIAVVCGTCIGILLARNAWFRWAVDPLVSLAFPAPKIAFVPVFILWFGIGDLSKILLVAFTCIFPIIISVYYGVSSVSKVVLWSSAAMGTSSVKTITHIIFPSTLPYIITGIRVTFPMALITAFTAEMVAGGGGIGALLMFAQRFFETPTVFAYILLMVAMGLVVDWLLLKLRHRVIPWQSEDLNL